MDKKIFLIVIAISFILAIAIVSGSSEIGLDLIYPTGDINASYGQFFNVTVNVSCSGGDCGDINISLDPTGTGIDTCTILQNMSSNLSGSFYLMNDIDCAGFDSGDGKGFSPVGNNTINPPT